MTETHSRPMLYKDFRTGEVICVSIEIEGEPLEAEFLKVALAFLETREHQPGPSSEWAGSKSPRSRFRAQISNPLPFFLRIK